MYLIIVGADRQPGTCLMCIISDRRCQHRQRNIKQRHAGLRSAANGKSGLLENARQKVLIID